MATPGEKLADSLHRLKGIQDNGIIAIKSDLLGRIHKTRLSQKMVL
jgi:hypothetical protein